MHPPSLRRVRARSVSLAVAAALAACTSSPAQQQNNLLANNCSTDVECQSGFKCDREQRRCVCTGDAACPGQYCNAFTGQCVASVPGCTSDAACAKGQYCERALRSCQAITGTCGLCKSDAECGASSKCAKHPSYPGAGPYCEPLCQTVNGGAGSCAGGSVCLASPTGDQLCYPAAGGCGQTNACTPDSLAACSSNADCNDPNQVCDQQQHTCVAATRICPAGDACDPQQKVCAHACSIDADCTQIEGGTGYACRDNACFRLQTCTADADCSNGQICTANPDASMSCKAGCTLPTDCPLGQSCSTATPAHPRCLPQCASNSDCPLNAVCTGSTCQTTSGSCTQNCQATQSCPVAAYCGANSCCVDLSLAAACPPIANSCTARGCTADFCNANGRGNEFVLSVGSCSVPADCSIYPGTTCVVAGGVGYCQISAFLQTCGSNADCAAKGFSCDSLAKYGCSGGGGVCVPQELSAQRACLAGHR